MTIDDVLAYVAALPKSSKPTSLRSDSTMLKVWVTIRKDVEFFNDIIVRHNLSSVQQFDSSNPTHNHAIGNALGMCSALARAFKGD